MTYTSNWAFDDQPEADPRDVRGALADGQVFRRRMEHRVTEGMKHQQAMTASPDEVLQRRVDGRVVVQRRGGR